MDGWRELGRADIIAEEAGERARDIRHFRMIVNQWIHIYIYTLVCVYYFVCMGESTKLYILYEGTVQSEFVFN